MNHGLCAVLRSETPNWYLKAVRHGWYRRDHVAARSIEDPHAHYQETRDSVRGIKFKVLYNRL